MRDRVEGAHREEAVCVLVGEVRAGGGGVEAGGEGRGEGGEPEVALRIGRAHVLAHCVIQSVVCLMGE